MQRQTIVLFCAIAVAITAVAGDTCTFRIKAWNQCGGFRSNCPSSTNATYPGTCCQSGYRCVYNNDWWWGCAEAPAGYDGTTLPEFCKSASTPFPSVPWRLGAWSQCGGKNNCGSLCCVDAPWPSTVCQTGYSCTRQNEWYYQCIQTPTQTPAYDGDGNAPCASGNPTPTPTPSPPSPTPTPTPTPSSPPPSSTPTPTPTPSSPPPPSPSPPSPSPPPPSPSPPPTPTPTPTPTPSPSPPSQSEPYQKEDYTFKPSGDYDFARVMNLSLMFFEAQRTGRQPAGNRIPWRRDSFVTDNYNGVDVSGGWFDAGDLVNFNFPQAWAAGVLAWGALEFNQGWQSSGFYPQLKSSLRWVSDYFLKCWLGNNVLVGQVGNGQQDHDLWRRPEDVTTPRPAYVVTASSPGSDLAGLMAGALAAISLVLRADDSAYADSLVSTARQIYTFGNTYKGKYSNSIPDANNFYSSSNMYDDLAWGAAWLYKATNEVAYLDAAENHFKTHLQQENGEWNWNNYNWDSMGWGARALLYSLRPTSTVNNYKAKLDSFAAAWFTGNGDGYNTNPKYTPGGLAWFGQWGATRSPMNAALLMNAYAKYSGNDTLVKKTVCWAQGQMRYVLGQPNGGRSYVVGYGNNPPLKPHHRPASCPWPPAPCDWNTFNLASPNPHVLFGALVGGPDLTDTYTDSRGNYMQNEEALDANAGFTGVLALLNQATMSYQDCVNGGWMARSP